MCHNWAACFPSAKASPQVRLSMLGLHAPLFPLTASEACYSPHLQVLLPWGPTMNLSAIFPSRVFTDPCPARETLPLVCSPQAPSNSQPGWPTYLGKMRWGTPKVQSSLSETLQACQWLGSFQSCSLFPNVVWDEVEEAMQVTCSICARRGTKFPKCISSQPSSEPAIDQASTGIYLGHGRETKGQSSTPVSWCYCPWDFSWTQWRGFGLFLLTLTAFPPAQGFLRGKRACD